MMMGMAKKETSHWWWFDSHNTSKRSPWLQSTLSELDNKTKAMLKLIEQDADSFAQRAEMYYKKRPELISMVEDFYRAHRSLAERHDQLKSDSGNRILTTMRSPFSTKCLSEKSIEVTYESYDSQSDTYDHDDCAESEVDDPDDEEIQADEIIEQRKEIPDDEETRRAQVSSAALDREMMQLREEVERLKEENRIQKDQLLEKDEEKREVIRQLSLAMDMLKIENVKLKKYVAEVSPKKRSNLKLEKFKDAFLGKLFNTSPRSRGSIIAI